MSEMSTRPPEPPSTAHGWVRGLAAVLSIAWVFAMLVVFALRIGYPLELEWMEGGTLQHALRLREGRPIYGPPSAEFVPFLYPPLYPWVIAELSWLFGLDFPIARALSIFATAGSCALGYVVVVRAGKPRAHALLAAASPLAAYVFTFRWLDLARADALMLALLLAGIVALEGAITRTASSDDPGRARLTRAVAGGVLIALACWTKQTALPIAVCAWLGVAIGHGRAARGPLIAHAVVVLACVLGVGLAMDLACDGWLSRTVLWGHTGHGFNRERLLLKTWWMHAHAAPFVVATIAWVIGSELWMRRRAAVDAMTGASREPTVAGDPRLGPASPQTMAQAAAVVLWSAAAVGGLAVGALGYSTQWAEPNAFIPGVALSAIALALALPAGGRREAVALLLWSSQLAMSAAIEPVAAPLQTRGLAGLRESYRLQDLSRTVPPREDRERARAQRRELEELARAGAGPILALHRPWWSVLAGPGSADPEGARGEGRAADHWLRQASEDAGAAPHDGGSAAAPIWTGHVGAMGLWDVDGPTQRVLRRALLRTIEAKRWNELWFDDEPPAWMRSTLRDRYVLDRRIVGQARVRTWSGWMSDAGVPGGYRRPQVRLRLRADRPMGEGHRLLFDFEDGHTRAYEVDGDAFGRGTVSAVHETQPIAGPIGGRRLLSSAAARGVAGKGHLVTPRFILDQGESLELLLGYGGKRRGLRATLIDDDDRVVATLPLGAGAWQLAVTRWPVPDTMAGQALRLELFDDSPRGALLLDDVRVIGR